MVSRFSAGIVYEKLNLQHVLFSVRRIRSPGALAEELGEKLRFKGKAFRGQIERTTVILFAEKTAEDPLLLRFRLGQSQASADDSLYLFL